MQVWSGLDYNRDGFEKDNKLDGVAYSKEYGAFFMAASIVFLATLMVVCTSYQASLIGFHSYLLISNISTWEFLSAHKIDYIQCFPYGYSPFDRGVVQNLKDAFLHGNSLKKWELPDVKQVWELHKKQKLSH